MVKVNMIEAYPREIVVLNVVGSSPTGHPTKRHRISGVFLFILFGNFSNIHYICNDK